jgi:anti-anti-sigma factor
MMQPFHAASRSVNDLVIIDLQGEINAFANQELQAVYDQAEGSPAQTILLNFKEVNYINSTGIAMIVGLLAKARQSRRRIIAFGLSEHYQDIFNITRLSDYIAIFPDETAALQALSGELPSHEPPAIDFDL